MRKVMMMAARSTRDKRPKRGVDELREARPGGPQQFAEILATEVCEQKPGRTVEPAHVAPDPHEIDGLSDDDLKRLEQDEERYAAARRAATAGGRTKLYE